MVSHAEAKCRHNINQSERGNEREVTRERLRGRAKEREATRDR